MFYRIICTIYTILLTILAGILLASALGWSLPQELLQTAFTQPESRWIMGIAAGIVFIFGIAPLVSSLNGQPSSDQALVETNSLGDVKVSLRALEDSVIRAGRQIEGIRDLKPLVQATSAGVVIEVLAMVVPDTNIPQASRALQERIKDYVQNVVGVPVLETKVTVQNIAAGVTGGRVH